MDGGSGRGIGYKGRQIILEQLYKTCKEDRTSLRIGKNVKQFMLKQHNQTSEF